MIQIQVNGIYDKEESPTFHYQNAITGEIIQDLVRKEVLELIKQDIRKGFVVVYPAQDFDIDDFI